MTRGNRWAAWGVTGAFMALAAAGAAQQYRQHDPQPAPSVAPSPTPKVVVLASPSPVSGPCGLGSPNPPQSYPGACYTPYSGQSVWNVALGSSPSVDPNSASEVAYYTSKFPMFNKLEFGYKNASNQYQHPIYFGHASDPVYGVKCSASWSSCVGGTKFHIPAYAVPAGGSDAHLTAIDETNGNELDCWGTTKPSGVGGTLTAQACGYGAITGNGLGFGQTAAGYAQWAGVIRAQELASGQINHALFIVAPCTSLASVYPSNERNTDTECSGGGGAPYGARFRLNMTDAQLNALNVASYKKAVYVALAHYGGYIGDTNGNQQFSIQTEADEMYTAPKYTNSGCPSNGAPCTPATQYMHSLGDPTWTGDRYSINLSEVDWSKYGQFLAPPAH